MSTASYHTAKTELFLTFQTLHQNQKVILSISEESLGSTVYIKRTGHLLQMGRFFVTVAPQNDICF